MADTCAGHILVVDDNRMNRLKLARGLENQGHSVALAENGIQALEMVKNHTYDLILLDILMPEMDGYHVLEKLKYDDALRDIPVIVISAIDEMDSIIKCIEMGAEDYLPKPFDAVLLKARIGAALEKKRLRDQEQLYAKSMERDLEIGRQIQSSFFPEFLPQVPGWEIASRFQAARQVSGDFYDAFILSGDSGVGIIVADVCDKGVGAALFMGLIRSLIRAFSELYYQRSWTTLIDDAVMGGDERALPAEQETVFKHPRALEVILSHINNYIARTHSQANMFATLFWGVIDPVSGTISYINAGHESAVVIGPNRKITFLEPTGPAVGMMPDMLFQTEQIVMTPGDILIAFTDGVTEARGTDGEFYGEEKLLNLIKEPAASAGEILDRIEKSLSAHTKGVQQSDDITLLTVSRIL